MPATPVSERKRQQNLDRVLARAKRGHVEVARSRRLVARLTPAVSAVPAEPWPDLEARARSVFGRRVLGTAGSNAVSKGRGDLTSYVDITRG